MKMKIGLVAPSGCYSKEKLRESCLFVENIGHETVFIGPKTADHGYFSSGDKNRYKVISEAVERDDIDIIWIIRGGYGVARILPMLLNFKGRVFPKKWIGFSDATALFPILHKMDAGEFFYGPNFIELCNTKSYHKKSLFNFIECKKEIVIQLKSNQIQKCKPFSGTLIGGCLTLLVNLIGTGCEPDYNNSILLLEETNEEPYRIDRLLTHLRNSGRIDKVKAILLGDFSSCKSKGKKGLSLSQVFDEILLPLNIPIVKGIKIGHCNKKITIPLFGITSFDAANESITFKSNPKNAKPLYFKSKPLF